MKNVLFSTLFLFVISALPAQSVDDIIIRHLEAVGADNWKDVSSLRMEANVTVENAPGMEIPVSITIVNQKSARIDVSVMGMNQISCINGNAGWGINPFAGQTEPEPLTADQVESMKDMTDLAGPLFGYKEKGYSVEHLGKEDVDGVEAIKLKINMGANKTQYSFLDPENFFEIKTIKVETVNGKEMESSSLNSNFQEVNGIYFPFTVEQYNPMMGESVTTMNRITMNPEITDKFFDMPAK